MFLGTSDSGIRYREGKPVTPMDKTYEMALDPEAYANAVAEKYGINLNGSGKNVTISYNPDLPSIGRINAANPTVS